MRNLRLRAAMLMARILGVPIDVHQSFFAFGKKERAQVERIALKGHKGDIEMITYQPFLGGVRVMLDGKRIGVIQNARAGGYFYQPVGSKAVGETFPTVAAVKRSLEA